MPGEAKAQSDSTTLFDVLKRGHVDVGLVCRAFDQCRPATLTESAASLTAGATSDAEMISFLVAAAHQGKFWDAFISEVGVLVKHAVAANKDDVWRLLDTFTPDTGYMHAIIDANRGQTDLEAMYRIIDAGASIGCLVDTEKPATSIGTAFLVGDDVVLTCAHVVEAAMAAAGATKDDRDEKLSKQVIVKFPNRRGLHKPIDVKVKCELLRSQPFGKPPHMAIVDTDESKRDAAGKLDYAFLRLATQPSGLAPLDIISPPKPRKTGLNHVIGFPDGGLACKYDATDGQDYIEAAARINHPLNATSGMSGSPCMDSDGRIYGLHEGSVASGKSRYNRAVSMEKIIKNLGNGAQLLSRNVGKLWLDDPEARRSWAQAGLGLAGAERAEWIEKVMAVGDPSPESALHPAGFHPVFPRADFANWIRDARAKAAAQRLLLLGGSHGAGKSFCRHMLAALPAEEHRVVCLPHDAAVNPDRLAVNAALRKAALIPPLPGDFLAGVRPIPGSITHDEVPPLVQDLVAAAGTGLMWLFIDFHRGDGWPGETKAFWTAFAARAAEEPSLRLVYVGLKAAAVNDLKQTIAQAARINLTHPNVEELQSYIKLFVPARATGRQADEPDFAKEVDDVLADYQDLLDKNSNMATVEAVRLIILIAEILTKDEGP
ncbi:MAG: serine protease [Parvibaculaceae bacterium]